MIPMQILSKIKPGKYGQWVAGIIVSMCAMSAALGFAWTAGALPKIRTGEPGFTLDLTDQSWVASILFLGNFISPIPSSYLMEKLGRRNSLCVGVWLNVIAFVIILFAKSFWPLCIARILKGLWIGLIYTVVPVYIGECIEPKVRGVLGTFYGTFLYVGSLMASFIGSYFSYMFQTWYSMFFSVLISVLLCMVPESPYYYLSKGKVTSARDSLCWLRGYCDETVLGSIEESIEKSKKNQSSFGDVFKRPSTRKAFFIVLLLGSVQRTSGLVILLSYTSITLPDYIVTSEWFTVVLNVVWIVFCIPSGFIIDRLGRRPMMGISCAGSSITMLGVAGWFYARDQMQLDISSIPWLPHLLLIIHGAFYAIGLVSIPTMMPGEVFPPEIKSKASSLVSIWVALVSGLTLNVYIPLQTSVGSYTNFLICSVSSLVGALAAAFYMIETKGRSLEQILDELEGKHTEEKTTASTRF